MFLVNTNTTGAPSLFVLTGVICMYLHSKGDSECVHFRLLSVAINER